MRCRFMTVFVTAAPQVGLQGDRYNLNKSNTKCSCDCCPTSPFSPCAMQVCVCVGEELKHMSTSKDGRRRSEKRKPLYEVNLRCWSRKKRIGEEKKMSVTSQAKSQSLKKVQ